MFEQCRWLNEPDRWALVPDGLAVTTNQATDFWRETHYCFTRDSGHFFGREVLGGFTASIRVRARYESLYDQAGIMVRLDDETWIKAGVELSDGEAMLGSVLTVGRSDWATGPFQGNASDFLIRVTVNRGVLRLQSSTDGLRWPLARLCPFPWLNATRSGRCVALPSGPGWKFCSPISPLLHRLAARSTICPDHQTSRVALSNAYCVCTPSPAAAGWCRLVQNLRPCRKLIHALQQGLDAGRPPPERLSVPVLRQRGKPSGANAHPCAAGRDRRQVLALARGQAGLQ